MNRIHERVKKNKGTPLRLPTGKAVGKLFGSVAAFKVKRSRHYFRALGGYSLDSAILDELGRLGVVKTIEFRDSELSETFKISLPTFRAHAKPCPQYGFGRKVVAHERFYQDDSAEDFLPGMIAATNAPGHSAQAGAH